MSFSRDFAGRNSDQYKSRVAVEVPCERENRAGNGVCRDVKICTVNSMVESANRVLFVLPVPVTSAINPILHSQPCY